MSDLLARLKNVIRSGGGWTARCPAHDDGRNSLSIHHRDGRWLLKCHAGCGFEEIIGALGMSAVDFLMMSPASRERAEGGCITPKKHLQQRNARKTLGQRCDARKTLGDRTDSRPVRGCEGADRRLP